VEHLWSPWRLAYVTGGIDADRCIFCDAWTAAPDDSLIVFRGRLAFVILNLYPYNNGHLMIVPVRHVATLAGLSSAELIEVAELTRRAEMALQQSYQPNGINVGMNLGRSAGAGVLDHLHVHVVPRWSGDTNFMSVVGNVRVVPEELPATLLRLRPIFEQLDGQ
jgi:ATP adenylyltransferase